MPAGRPREFDVETALESAMALFWRQGYRGTTTRQLEGALGVRQASLYRVFGSKAGLMEAATGRYEDLLAQELLGPLRAGPGLAAIDRFLVALGEWLEADDDRGCLLGRLLAEGAPPDAELRTLLERFHAGLRAALTEALHRAAGRGEIDAATVASRAALLEAVVLGLNLAHLGGYGPSARRDIVDGVRAEVAAWGRRTAAPVGARHG